MWPDEDELLYNLLDDLPTSHGFEPNTRPWLGQEVIDQGGEPIKKDEYVGMGAVTEFNYCFSLANLQNSLAQLRTVADRPQNWGFLTDKNAFVFVNNHDNQRGHGGGGGIVTFESPQSLKVILYNFSQKLDEPEYLVRGSKSSFSCQIIKKEVG